MLIKNVKGSNYLNSYTKKKKKKILKGKMPQKSGRKKEIIKIRESN